MEELNYIQDSAEAVQELDKNLLVLRLTLGKLEAALERAFAPLANLILPMVNRVLHSIIGFVNDVAAVIGSLFGYVRRSATKTVRTTGSAVKKALAGFDEIQRLSFGGGGGSSTTTLAGEIIELPDRLKPVVEKIRTLLKPLQDIDFSAAVAAFGKLKAAIEPLSRSLFAGLEWAWFNILVPIAKWTVEEGLPVFLETLASAARLLAAAIEYAKPMLSWLWENLLKPMAQWAGTALIQGLTALNTLLEDMTVRTQNLQPNTKALAEKVDSLKESFGRLTGGVGEWNNTSGSFAGGLLKLIDMILRMGNAFSGVIVLVSSLKSGLQNLSQGTVGAIKSGVNTAIGSVNGAIRSIQGVLNAVIANLNSIKIQVPDWIPGIGGKKFSMNLRTVSLPTVPYLAKGAVLPANKPFLAVVGDQRHGTNVEAPLSVIQDAVANVMGAGLQGQDETCALLRQLLAAVEGITIGDETIGRAARRYESRRAVMGGVL